MTKEFILNTKRMKIFPLSDYEMKILVNHTLDMDLKQAYLSMLNGSLEHPENRIWYTVWDMVLNDGSNIKVGDLCFKGLSPSGVVEIGYGIEKAFEGLGLMTEAVIEMTKWASQQEGVTRVEAEIEPDNIASQRVLEKAGFRLNGVMGEEGPRYVFNASQC
ncbi:MAG: GNAT family N-acetyltransferase [Clostridia bacterium]|nr:GNAT family N-acetyltransferase [Clostridia bacterium]